MATRVTSPLAEPLSTKVLGPAVALLEKELGITTVGDLLRHYPRRYGSWGQLTALSELPVGETVTILAEVRSVSKRAMKARRGTMLVAVVTDGTSDLELTFFSDRGPQRALVAGRRGMFSGTVGVYRDKRQLTHPTIELIDDDTDEDAALAKIDKPIVIYPASAKLTSARIAACMELQLAALPPLEDPLPADLLRRRSFLGIDEAFHKIHRPDDADDYTAARRRFRFEEAFVLQVALARRRLADGAQQATARVPSPGGLLAAFDERLPFTLTPGQETVGAEIAADLARTSPMHRLLQGEVGSGKTVVALRAMLACVDAGGQAALLAPTEVLAAQHYRAITTMLGDLAAGGMLGGDERGTRVVLLTGSLPAAVRKKAMLDAVSGDAGIVVGTHALLQEKVEFLDLGLVVVDEQHRFGVEQRDALRGKGRTVPHLLVMTATPIPRTVAMTVFGDLETSTLAELPAGRSPIATHVVPAAEKPGWYDRTWTRLREEIDAGHQGYVVCPRIGEGAGEGAAEDGAVPPPDDEGARRPMRGVLEVLEELRATPALAGLRVEMLHGRLPADERDATMRAFARGDVHVLVATTVIEVGVDVPNATAMVVLDADRFGVSQLHQLRGRVGRGSAAGLCLLVTDLEGPVPGRERLDAVARTLDGFELARVDLEQRREGDVLSSRQHGRSSLRLLRVLKDEVVIETARREATTLVTADPDLSGHPELALEIALLLDEEQEAYLERG
ncbi:ATP-dependent DNA helicase RecG [Kineosporia sp. A_224]|uniref:ATP-dependent DNA helicase RecG n=1 Tax=Kineosporia sp. A_224 TaxID=1962180 RepID=UPI0018E921F6|nr:ATP-dependent DNA helicase RecG [Kineosporia sp. A_224]